ncbi:MAG TPA: hypothetical protein ENJ56_04890 [Anaerolineae bacterium]|nr:hypothetical protein [Anaerolineae bacterium]
MIASIHTGKIQDDGRGKALEYSDATAEIAFSAEQHAIWHDLFTGIFQTHLLEHICAEWHEGMRRLQLNPNYIPSVAHLNRGITSHSGWRIERTVVRYTKADDWYKKFAQRIFLITDYLRNRAQMEFTPEPDMFHDIFGHFPFLTMPFYAAIEDKFAPAYWKANEAEREVIRRLAWYSTEFGLVMQDNRMKMFGAGIISGRAELTNTIMEFYRLDRDNVIDYRGDVYAQICDNFYANRATIDRVFSGINQLHERGKMASAESGWNVIHGLYDQLGIARQGYFGGDVLLAPFDIDYIAKIPKTVYAMNPVFFVFESFEKLDQLLDSYLQPIAER